MSCCKTFETREELNFSYQRTQQNCILAFSGSSCPARQAEDTSPDVFSLAEKPVLKRKKKARNRSGFPLFNLLCVRHTSCPSQPPGGSDDFTDGGDEVRVLQVVSLGVKKAESLQRCISLPQRDECLVCSLKVLLSLQILKKRRTESQQAPSSLEKVVSTDKPFHSYCSITGLCRATPASKCFHVLIFMLLLLFIQETDISDAGPSRWGLPS